MRQDAGSYPRLKAGRGQAASRRAPCLCHRGDDRRHTQQTRFHVTRIDRLARSLRDLQNLIYELKERGISLKATEQPIDTNTAAGKCFLDMLGVFAEFETNIRSERQREGIRRAKANGAYATAIARALGCDRASVYRLMKASAWVTK